MRRLLEEHIVLPCSPLTNQDEALNPDVAPDRRAAAAALRPAAATPPDLSTGVPLGGRDRRAPGPPARGPIPAPQLLAEYAPDPAGCQGGSPVMELLTSGRRRRRAAGRCRRRTSSWRR